jgi:hypothetical protein
MNNYRGNPRDRLVHLELIDPFNITPIPDKSIQGQLARMLKSVGSKGKYAVRARMITAVSNTKYKTLEGDPISLVGLHGKGEMLSKGPAWAIERLAEGVTPDFDERVSELQGELERYRGLAEKARLLDDPGELPDQRWLITRTVADALRRIKEFDPVQRKEALAFVDGVIAKLEVFIAECENGTIPWWFFWSTSSASKRQEIGLPEDGSDPLQRFASSAELG